MYAMSSILCTLTIKDKNFVEINKNYLIINNKKNKAIIIVDIIVDIILKILFTSLYMEMGADSHFLNLKRVITSS